MLHRYHLAGLDVAHHHLNVHFFVLSSVAASDRQLLPVAIGAWRAVDRDLERASVDFTFASLPVRSRKARSRSRKRRRGDKARHGGRAGAESDLYTDAE
jgi:hypothetical protein